MLYTRISTYRNEVKFFASTLQNQKSPSKKCANAYTYGFNGKEKDDETGWQDYGERMYNPQLSRFFSLDPFVRIFHTFPLINMQQMTLFVVLILKVLSQEW